MLKNEIQKLVEIITYVFNLSINEHLVPEDWKTAYITPIYKKSDNKRCDNYRGLSVTHKYDKYVDYMAEY